MTGKTVAVLGGGVGGLMAANLLRKLLPEKHRVVLVERNAMHSLAASYLWVMTGDREPEAIVRPVQALLRPGVEPVLSEVTELDLSRCVVRAGGRRLSYDYLVIASGAELAPETIPGLDGALTFYTLDGAVRVRDELRGFAGGSVAIVVSALPYKCPGAPHEGALLIADTLRRRGLGRRTEIHLYTPEPQPMPVAGPALGEAVRSMLDAKDVHFHPVRKLREVRPDQRELLFDDRDTVPYDLLIAIPPHRGTNLARQSGLANELGWIPIDASTLRTRLDNVYAIGDATTVSLPGRWKPDVPLSLPKAGVFAHCEADIVARRITAQITGASCTDAFAGEGYCVLEAGGRAAGFAFGDFFATPYPKVEMRDLGMSWHIGKVLFEKWWLARFGPWKELLRLGINAGCRARGLPIHL